MFAPFTGGLACKLSDMHTQRDREHAGEVVYYEDVYIGMQATCYTIPSSSIYLSIYQSSFDLLSIFISYNLYYIFLPAATGTFLILLS